jgi:hypothetical protein
MTKTRFFVERQTVESNLNKREFEIMADRNGTRIALIKADSRRFYFFKNTARIRSFTRLVRVPCYFLSVFGKA